MVKGIKFPYYLIKHTKKYFIFIFILYFTNLSKKIKKKKKRKKETVLYGRKFATRSEFANTHSKMNISPGLAIVYFACLARCVYLHGNVCRSVAEARPRRISFPQISVSIVTGGKIQFPGLPAGEPSPRKGETGAATNEQARRRSPPTVDSTSTPTI